MAEGSLLESGLSSMGIAFSGHQLDLINIFIGEIELWNPKYGLVGASGDELVVRHILDSLSAVPVLQNFPFRSAADAGSGAGLPGIPLAVFFPEAEFTLIEKSGRRAGFLRNAVGMLGLGERVRVLESPVEKVAGEFDLVLFRAFRQLNEFYPVLERITSPEGILFAYKGRLEKIREELSGLITVREPRMLQAAVPFLEEERTFCIFLPAR